MSRCLNSFLVLLVALSIAPAEASAFCRMTTEGEAQVGDQECSEDGLPLEWRDACLQYSIDERGSFWMDMGDIESAVMESFDAWQDQSCGSGGPANVIFSMGAPSTCQKPQFVERGPNVNTIAFLNPWVREDGEPYPQNAFAVTIVWFREDTGQILDADMLINDTLGPYDNCPDTGCPMGSPGPADLASIVTHEAGHFIGIGHSDIADATMFPSSPRVEVQKRTLAGDDINAVCTIYPPGDLNSMCDNTPMGGLDVNCEDGDPPLTSNGGGCGACRVHGEGSSSGAFLLGLMTLIVLRRRSAQPGARY